MSPDGLPAGPGRLRHQRHQRPQQLRAVWRRDREGTRVELHAELLAEVAPQLELLVVPTGTEIVLPPNGRP